MSSPFSYRVKAARIQKGITQEEVARAVGISKQAISQYENGRKKPDSKTLLSLAKYFEKPPGFFLRPLKTPLEQVEFRKRASLKGRKLAAVKSSIQDRLEPYLELENLLGIDHAFQNPLEKLLIEKVEDAETAATLLLQVWELGFNPIPNALEMLEDHGFKVVEVRVDDRFDGLSTFVNGAIPVIVINQEFDSLRKRFTAMHELGHLLLQFPHDAEHKFKEQVCNRFAGAMLLPGPILIDELGKRRTGLSFHELIPIKEYHGISLAAIIYRGKDLGIFPESLVRRFWQRRNQEPALKHENTEKYGTYKGEERAFRFRQLLSRAFGEEIISLSKAAELSGRKLEDIRHEYQLI